jgi:hypothetical protein
MAAHSPPSLSPSLSLSLGARRTGRRWIANILGATLVFNVIDVIFTLIVVLLGFAVEANPVMQRALDAGPLAFAVIKISVVSLGVLLLWRERRRPLAVAGSVGIFAAYGLLMMYHAHWLVELVA